MRFVHNPENRAMIICDYQSVGTGQYLGVIEVEARENPLGFSSAEFSDRIKKPDMWRRIPISVLRSGGVHICHTWRSVPQTRCDSEHEVTRQIRPIELLDSRQNIVWNKRL